jgi:hypothetical protein
MRSRLRYHSIVIILGLMISVTALAKKGDPPEVTEEGLHLVKDSKFALVYAEPGATLVGYHRIRLLEPHIAFKKNWKRNQNRNAGIRVSDKDVDRIRTSLAEEFNTIFAEVLQENDGYELVDESGEDVLTLRPAIINLDVKAPDTMTAGRSRSYSESAGEMTLYLEAYDSLTNDLIAKALDRKHDRYSGFMTWQTSASNTAAGRRILRGWAQTLRDGLDEAHSATAPDEGAED